MENAIKFANSGRSITLSSYREDRIAVIKISAFRVGISESNLERIFERFYQAEKLRRGDQRRGTGLGLAIVFQIMLSHGRSIEVKSEVGKGNTYMVKLPLENGKDQKKYD